MPRPNPARKIEAERLLARRIAMERTARSWSNEVLAQRMTEVGCSVQPSALYKIQYSERPRRITVDELVALSIVFGVSVHELLSPADDAIAGLARDRFDAWLEAFAEQDLAVRRMQDAEARLRAFLKRLPEAELPLRRAIADWLRDYSGYDEEDAIDAVMRTFTAESEALTFPVSTQQKKG